jgi:hypothetical protein
MHINIFILQKKGMGMLGNFIALSEWVVLV